MYQLFLTIQKAIYIGKLKGLHIAIFYTCYHHEPRLKPTLTLLPLAMPCIMVEATKYIHNTPPWIPPFVFSFARKNPVGKNFSKIYIMIFWIK